MNDNARRPLSPHMGIYHWPIGMVTSITHRATGIVLSAGSIFLAVWLCAAALGPDAFAAVNGIAAAWYGQVLMFGWTLVLFFHLCNGIRHLAWDAVIGLELETARTTGFIAFGAAVALTVIVWILAWLV